MTDDADEGELSRIEGKIAGLAEAALSNGQDYLLSELGIALGTDLLVLKRASGKRLVEFIKKRLSSRFEIVRYGSHDSIYAMAYAGGQHPAPRGSAGDHGSRGTETSSSKGPRFNSRFWAAFSVPIKSEIRLLDARTLTFTDVARPDVLPEEQLAIEADCIPEEGVEDRDRHIASNIASWLQAQHLPASRFVDNASRPAYRHEGPGAARPTSVLEHVLDCLDKHQLQNTTLTLGLFRSALPREPEAPRAGWPSHRQAGVVVELRPPPDGGLRQGRL